MTEHTVDLPVPECETCNDEHLVSLGGGNFISCPDCRGGSR